jgi:hypothetical protein
VADNFVKSALRAFIEAEFGGPTTEQESYVALPGGAVFTLLVPNNAERISLTFVNVAVNDAAITLNATGSTGGIHLTASGGAVSFNIRDDATLPGRLWYGFSSAASNLYVLEVIRSIYTPVAETGITRVG